MLGESNVGKTSLVTRYTANKFENVNNLLTIGIDIRKVTRVINGQSIRI
jgi:GTPase SAR1 family protein